MTIQKTGRHDPCPCGSGKKYKQCCRQRDDAQSATSRVLQAFEAAHAHHQAGRLAQAEAVSRQLLQVAPDHADALHLLGVIECRRGNFADAVDLIRKASLLAPSCVVFCNLGIARLRLGELDQAAASFRQALSLQPQFAEAQRHLCDALAAQGQYEEAAEVLRQLLALNPGDAPLWSNLGIALKEQGQLDESIACLHKGLALTPDDVNALNNLGLALQEQGKLDEAVASFRRALALAPRYAKPHSNLLFTLSFHPQCPPGQYIEEARRYGESVRAQAQPYTHWPSAVGDETPRPMRIGLVSGDFRKHPVGHFIESILAQLDAARIELVAYVTTAAADELTARIKPRFSAWHNIAAWDDPTAARHIRDDGIHILIDLAGHTGLNRLPLFAWKPAPVQAAWLGYFASTGLATIDYIVCDPYALPACDEPHFVESPWRLPHTRLCFTPPAEDIAVAPLPALHNGVVTFGCFNSLVKLNNRVVELWARVLHAVAGSRLVLKARQLADPTMRHATAAHFGAHGIEPARLILEGFSSRTDYLKAYDGIDVALDPFPFTGGTTSVEGLWMGVPFVTLHGDRMIGHQGEQILQNVNLAGWIAADHDDYVAKAVAKATDLNALATLRKGLRAQLVASPLCDAPQFARHLEQAFEDMWQARKRPA